MFTTKSFSSIKKWSEFVRQDSSSRKEGVTERVAAEIGDPGGVHVGEPEKPPRKISRILVRSKHRPETRIEVILQSAPEI